MEMARLLDLQTGLGLSLHTTMEPFGTSRSTRLKLLVGCENEWAGGFFTLKFPVHERRGSITSALLETTKFSALALETCKATDEGGSHYPTEHPWAKPG